MTQCDRCEREIDELESEHIDVYNVYGVIECTQQLCQDCANAVINEMEGQ